MKRYAVIYMAAGNSRRFVTARQKNIAGEQTPLGNKLLQDLEGKPLYQHGLDTLAELAAKHEQVSVFVITRFQEILETARFRGLEAFLNPASGQGVSHTIRRGILEAGEAGPFDYLLFVTADQPYLSLGTLEKFLALGEKECFPVVSAAWRGQDSAAGEDAGGKSQREGANREWAEGAAGEGAGNMPGLRLGNPVMFAASLAGELEALSGDEGGRKVWRRYAAHSGFVYVGDLRELEDFDEPWDEAGKSQEKGETYGCGED